MDAVEGNICEISYPAYLPDLLPSDYFLSQNLIKISVDALFGATKKSGCI